MEVAGVGMVNEFGRKDGPILVLNSGSSSLKFGIFRPGATDEEPVLTGTAEGIGRINGALKIIAADGTTLVRRESIHESHSDALAALASVIRDHIDSTLVSGRPPRGSRRPEACQAPKHHAASTGSTALSNTLCAAAYSPGTVVDCSSQSIFPSALQYACFDNAFHQTIPEVASHLPIPQPYFDAGIRRYGFHGISYESLVHHFGAKLPRRAIFAHLGNGSSLCALLGGRSIDTTMGLTPTGGIPMGTRSGDLDPGVVLHLLRNEKIDADGLEDLLNQQSGLFALSSGESDVKTLEERARSGDPKAGLALDVFAVSVRKTIGSYTALLAGVDLLVFTGGIGEHSEYIRSASTDGLDLISLTSEKIQVIPTQEEKQISRHCRQMMKKEC